MLKRNKPPGFQSYSSDLNKVTIQNRFLSFHKKGKTRHLRIQFRGYSTDYSEILC